MNWLLILSLVVHTCLICLLAVSCYKLGVHTERHRQLSQQLQQLETKRGSA